MTARLAFLVLRDDARTPSLPDGTPFRAIPLRLGSLPDSWLADLELIAGEGERWRADMIRRCARHVVLLAATGEAEDVFGAARAALRAVVPPGGAVVDLLARRLFEPAVAARLDWSDPELLVRVETGWEGAEQVWVATRGLSKLGLSEVGVLVARSAEELHEGTAALVEAIARHLSQEGPAAPLAPGLELATEPAGVGSDARRAQERHLEAIGGLLRECAIALEPDLHLARIRRGAEDVTATEAARLRDAIRAEDGVDGAADRADWERPWSEREDLLAAAYGAPGEGERKVLAVPPAHPLRQRFPGLCVHAFEPAPERPEWFFVTHGPWQEATPERATYEFGMRVSEPAEWVPQALLQLLGYSLAAEPPLDRGHRIGFVLLREAAYPGGVQPLLPVDPDTLDPGDVVVGTTSAVVLWPTLDPWNGFTTERGDRLHILIATAITRAEWDFARRTSSTHLLLLLHLAGVGQTTDPARACVASDPATAELRSGIGRLSEEAAFDALYGRFARGEPPGD